MSFDLNESASPVYELVRVNGLLWFDDTNDRVFRAKHIFVRAGELWIGNITKPFQHKATIMLYGERNNAAIVYDNAIEAGNKLIANVNKVMIFGKPRLNILTRLLKPAEKGQKDILVDKGLDWVVGDRIALLATSFDSLATDDGWITAYDNNTGKLTINKTLERYHWGDAASTAANFDGMDIRGEVILLSRNVKIIGEDVDGWGGQFVTSDTIEVAGTPPVVKNRYGQTFLDNVEFYNMS